MYPCHEYLDNVGNEGHTYLLHIVRNYNSGLKRLTARFALLPVSCCISSFARRVQQRWLASRVLPAIQCIVISVDAIAHVNAHREVAATPN